MHIQSLTLALFTTVAISSYALPSTLPGLGLLDDLLGEGDGSSLLKRGGAPVAQTAPAAPAAAPATKPSSHKHGRGRKHKSHTHSAGKGGHATSKKVAQKDLSPVSGASSSSNDASSPLGDGATNALDDPTSMLSDPSSMLGSLPVVGDLIGSDDDGSGADPLDGVTSLLGGL